MTPCRCAAGSRAHGAHGVIALLIAALLAVTACAGRSRAPDTISSLLFVDCDVTDAEVFIGDQLAGRVGELRGGVRLRGGAHRVEVRHERYHTRYLDLALAAGVTLRVPVTLVEALD